MTDKLWKICVVGLLVASPVICSATTIPEALATAGDGKYVQMDPGSSITLSFTQDCSGTSPAVILKLAQASSGIRVEFYRDGAALYYFNGADWVLRFETGDTVYGPGQPESFDELDVSWEAVPFDSVKITAYGVSPVYLDAVLGAVTSSETVGGVYVTHGGIVTALTDDPAAKIGDLVLKVASFNLQQGIDNSLDAKLEAAKEALEDVNANNDASAINKLEAFISEVNAQRGKKITVAQADELVADAQAIIDLLASP